MLTSNCYLDFIGRVTLMVVISESSYQTCRNLRRLEQEYQEDTVVYFFVYLLNSKFFD